MAEGRGFEPLRRGSHDITVFKTGAMSRSANLPKTGAKGGNRTPNACAFNAALYQLSYLGQTAGASCRSRTGDLSLDRRTLWPPS